jgi:hypothetical protein
VSTQNYVHTEIVNLAGVLGSFELRPLADVIPFHIIGGHLSLYSPLPTLGTPIPDVLVGKVGCPPYCGFKFYTFASLEFISSQIAMPYSNLSFAALAQTITGNNPISGNPNETVSNITHLLLYNGGKDDIELDNIVLAMTIVYSS